MNRVSLKYDYVASERHHTNRFILTRGKGSPFFSEKIVDFVISEAQQSSPLQFLDGLVTSCLIWCMENVRELHVEGDLSQRWLQNASLFMESWERWVPERYRKVEVSADRIIREEDWRSLAAPGDLSGSVLSFSGGVDSTFSLLRHNPLSPLLGASSIPVRSAVFVHGFDIPFDEEETAQRAIERSRRVLEKYRVPLITVRTNIRRNLEFDWEHGHGAALAGVLHQFSSIAGTGIIPSAQSVDGVLSPWGTHPATDHFLSGSNMQIVHDGAGFDRISKTVAVSRNRDATKGLRVCWEGAVLDRNCGRCEKCLRTMMALDLAGVNPRIAFPHQIDADDVEKLQFRNSRIRHQFERILSLGKDERRLKRRKWLSVLASRLLTEATVG